MEQLRKVSKTEKIIFPIIVTVICVLLIPDVAPLIGMLMLGNLFRESGVTDRLNDTAQNALCNIVTIMLGVSVGATANGATFLKVQTLAIVGLGLVAFAFSTAGGVLLGKLMFYITKGKVNPLIGAAGVSAVPMAARVAQKGRPQSQPHQLPAHARNGPECGGCDRFRSCGGLHAVAVPGKITNAHAPRSNDKPIYFLKMKNNSKRARCRMINILQRALFP